MEKSPKVFIIYAHENPMSLCGNLKDRTIKLLQENNIYFKLSDLYAQKFNPIISWEDYVNMNAAKEIPFNLENYQKIGSDLNAFSKDISAELDKFLEADFLIFIAPMFWSSFPAIMKGKIKIRTVVKLKQGHY